MKEEGLQFSISAVTARLTVEEVSLYVIDGKGWNIIFDTEPTRIFKEDIHLPEKLQVDISKCPDYPPRLSIRYFPILLDKPTERSNPIKLGVDGLDRELCFNIEIPSNNKVPVFIGPRNTVKPDTKHHDPPQIPSLPNHCVSWTLDKPTLDDSLRILYPIAPMWENIGTFLKIPSNELSIIHHDFDGAHNCLREMLKLWLKRVTVVATWQSLAEAVLVIDSGIASEISERYRTLDIGTVPSDSKCIVQ